VTCEAKQDVTLEQLNSAVSVTWLSFRKPLTYVTSGFSDVVFNVHMLNHLFIGLISKEGVKTNIY
jgi:hypothetical protein